MTVSWRWAIAVVLLFCACSEDPAPKGGSPALVRRDSASAKAARSEQSAPIPDGPYWPRFHGPDGENQSSDAGLLKRWPEGGPALRWTAEGIGQGYSSVTLAGARIFTAGNVDGKTVVTALDLDGQTKWQSPNGPAWTSSYDGTRGTPTYDDGRVYHESPVGQLVCLDAKNGAEIWSLNILERFDGHNIRWALAESVLIDGDVVICCPGGAKGSVVGLDKRTGDLVWAAPGTGESTSYASPALAVCEGLRMVLTMNAKALIGVNADTGDLLFTFPHVTRYDVNALMPIYHDGHVFISSGYGSGSQMFKLTIDGNKARVEQVWENKQLDNHHGGVLLLEGYLYGSSAGGRWMCLDWKTGQTKYAEGGVGKGSLTYADGMLYTYSENRKMGLVEAGPERHEVVSQFTVPSGGGGKSWAHPVVCGGRLYLRHADKLYAYDVKGK